ncbi:hypothetical protein ACIL2V_004641 [Vibrio alginolyticus]|uniref:hypothetical protein n=1 Tax=Vibrio TaxID=662 RepID=UPI002852E536|nr:MULTISPECIES: hypothetical protein [Vibrio]MDW1895775.1 hypothetical protein [Vibrio sp. Vb1729]
MRERITNNLRVIQHAWHFLRAVFLVLKCNAVVWSLRASHLNWALVVQGGVVPRVTQEMSFDPMLHNEGEKFFNAAKILRQEPSGYPNTPYWTLLAFSIELMLKSLAVGREIIISKQNPCIINEVKLEHAKGHSLREVFNNLPERLKSELSLEFYEKSGLILSDILESHSMLFEQARYIYPKNGRLEYPHGITVDETSLHAVGEFLSAIYKRG